MEAKIIKKTINISAPKKAIFAALTTPKLVPHYFPVDKVECDFVEGGTISYVGEESGVDRGVIEVIDPNNSFQFSYWNPNHGTEDIKENWITINYELTSSEQQAMLMMTQTNIPSEQYHKLMEPAWDFLLTSLKTYVETNQDAL